MLAAMANDNYSFVDIIYDSFTSIFTYNMLLIFNTISFITNECG